MAELYISLDTLLGPELESLILTRWWDLKSNARKEICVLLFEFD